LHLCFNDRGGKDIEVIIVRLLNKGLKKFNSEDHADPSMLRHCTLEQHVKVCYQTGKAVDLIKGKEMRVPLDQDQYKEVRHSILCKNYGIFLS
jgi:DNA-binding transcriptional ArsR family regulator